uniref:ATP-dependent DNA helicase n=1 Tax=Tanacetum cinerariifolium TaxID=118510 RepID=A0A699GPD0_TANCI|nr:uncharacterized protein [Tanacetum cinerariifolium]
MSINSDKPTCSKTASKAAMLSYSSQMKPFLFLDQLEVDVTGIIVVMIGRVWDVNSVTGYYLSTEFVVSDANANMIHCSAKSTVAHNFLRLKGARKISADPHGFCRYPLCLIEFDQELVTQGNLMSRAAPIKAPLPIDCSQPREGTLENLLIWARNRQNNTTTFHCKVMIENFKTKKGWKYPSCGYEKCKKGATQKLRKWVCETCNRAVDYPVFRHRLKVVVADDTAHTVVVMFNDTATELLKCSTESLMGTKDEYLDADDELKESHWNEAHCTSSSTAAVIANDAELSMKILTNLLTVCTPLKPNEERKQKGHDPEDSDVDEVSGPEKKQENPTLKLLWIPKRKGRGPTHLRKAKKEPQKRHSSLQVYQSRAMILVLLHINAIFVALQCVEEQRLKWTRNNQDTLLVYLYHNLCDAATQGDTSAAGLEFQKHRLPHAYILLWLEEDYKCKTPSEIDDIILAKMPTSIDDPDGYKVFTDYMLHGPCSKDARNAACTNDGKCSRHFPNPFLAETFLDEEGYHHYRRRDNKVTFKKGKFVYDNKHVVAHNRYMLLKYKAHIKVEWCNKSKAIKYIFKYLNKGPDRATIVIEENVRNGTTVGTENILEVDEIKNYQNYQFLAPCEAVWRLFSFDINYSYQSVMHLSFHLPNQNAITLRDSEKNREEQIRNYCLMEIRDSLHIYGRSLSDFKELPEPDPSLLANKDNRLIREALDFNIRKSKAVRQHLHSLLNPEQQLIYEDVVQSVDNKKGNFYFVYGPRGTRNTFLYKTIISRLRQDQLIVLAVASSGIASLLLQVGRTAHSRFVIPLKLMENSTCGIKQNTQLAKLMQKEYPAKIHVRSKLHYLPLIKDRLNEARHSLFRTTCFGPCLDISGHSLHFGRRQFCLVTGFKFGLISLREHRNGDIPFRNRLFPKKIGYGVKIINVLAFIDDEEKFSKTPIELSSTKAERQSSCNGDEGITKEYLDSQLAEMWNLIATLSLQRNHTMNQGRQANQFGRLAKVKFPKFQEDDLREWVFRCDQFFSIDNTSNEEKVKIVSVHLTDKALLWHRVTIIQEHAINLYLGGLPTELEMNVRMFKPATPADAYTLTKLQEALKS